VSAAKNLAGMQRTAIRLVQSWVAETLERGFDRPGDDAGQIRRDSDADASRKRAMRHVNRPESRSSARRARRAPHGTCDHRRAVTRPGVQLEVELGHPAVLGRPWLFSSAAEALNLTLWPLDVALIPALARPGDDRLPLGFGFGEPPEPVQQERAAVVATD
jgi:hypothetical protein